MTAIQEATRETQPVPFSAFVLLGANTVPLFGVLFFDWSVFSILFLYWFENIAVGVFNILKMLFANAEEPNTQASKFFLIPFFTFHYGMFATVHGVFVLSLFGGGFTGRGFPTAATFAHAVQAAGIAPAAWGLALSHGVSFAFNYIGTGEYKSALVPALMFRPYGRVMVLHIVILGGGFLVTLFGSPLIPLALLVVLKTGLDLFGHLREHAAMGPTAPLRREAA